MEAFLSVSVCLLAGLAVACVPALAFGRQLAQRRWAARAFAAWKAFVTGAYGLSFVAIFFALPFEDLSPDAEPDLSGPFATCLFLTCGFSLLMWATHVFDACLRLRLRGARVDRGVPSGKAGLRDLLPLLVAAASPLTGGLSGLAYYLAWGRLPVTEPAPPAATVRVGHGARCPYCHDDLAEVGVVCATCLARHHRECWDQNLACASCARAERFAEVERTAGRPAPPASVKLPG